ncbi:MAG TPA: 4-alpha-glucanotransferase, partial [Candidatus Limnocylindria bacterium]
MSASLVDETYVDAFDREQTIAPDVRAAVIAAMGPDEPAGDPVAVVRRGKLLPESGDVILEDGTHLGRLDTLPADVPYGYHRLVRDDGGEQLVITGPGRCHLPRDLRAWGWAIQLAATRSHDSWGIGDLADLRQLGTWSASAGAGVLAVGPLGAPNPGPRPEPSPYYPSTRRFGNPLLLRMEDIPAADDCSDLAIGGHALNDDP